jgi:hypothetical protein
MQSHSQYKYRHDKKRVNNVKDYNMAATFTYGEWFNRDPNWAALSLV